MTDYDFSTLSSDEFELFVRDLLNSEERRWPNNYIFISTPKGRDRGIDLFCSTPSSEFDTIVQIKHYPKSKYSQLKNKLFHDSENEKSELHKVRKIRPDRYILVTSIELTVQQKLDIKEGFNPYIKQLDQIYDRHKLNALLILNPEVEKRHYKLYLSSVLALERILKCSHIGSGEFIKERIEQNIRIYVNTGNFEQGEELLRKNNFLLIDGEPGCGKTTLAELLLYKMIGEGYKLVYLHNITGADGIWNEEKQIFYFDDFLGHNYYEIENSDKEKPLHLLAERIASTKNKLLLLTTRTIIYNKAKERSDRFRYSILNKSKLRILMASYTQDQRIQIVKNHLHYKEIPNELCKDITEVQMREISRHPNFYPRIIWFSTCSLGIKSMMDEGLSFFEFTVKNLNNPSEIWKISYERQIDDYERIFLVTLLSLGDTSNIDFLRTAFESRLEYECHTYHLKITGIDFWDIYKSLSEAFIVNIQLDNYTKLVGFINPSVVDFLVPYLSERSREIASMVISSVYIEQILKRIRYQVNSTIQRGFLPYKDSEKKLLKKLTQKKSSITTIHSFDNLDAEYNYINFYKASLILAFHRTEKENASQIISFLDIVDFDCLEYASFHNILGLLTVGKQNDDLEILFLKKWISIINRLLDLATEPEHLNGIKDLFQLYSQSFKDFIDNHEYHQYIKSIIDEYRDYDIKLKILDIKDVAVDLEIIRNAESELYDLIINDYENYFIKDEPNLEEFTNVDWVEIIGDNIEKRIIEEELKKKQELLLKSYDDLISEDIMQ